MERERVTSGNGHTRGHAPQHALGDVARDVMDQASVILRDRLKIGKLEARRYVEHVRRDLAPRAAYGAVTAALATVAVLCGLVALLIGIAHALGSVAWAFAIYAAAFAVATIVALSLGARPPRRDEGEEIARRFPAARTKESQPEHLLVTQRSTPEAHWEEIREARRETHWPS